MITVKNNNIEKNQSHHMSQKNNSADNIPKLRFPEFKDAEEWKEKEFDKLFQFGNGRDYKHLSGGDIPVYGSGGYMLSVNDFLYDGESVCIGRKGTIDKPLFLTGKFWTVDTLFYTHSFKNCVPKFIYLIFQNVNWYNYNAAGGVPSLSKSTIGKIKSFIPELQEQQKIASCLSSLDELIAAENQKLETLKTHKKGLMQQLFPTEGETVPKLRFTEFKDDGEWEELPIGGKVELLSGYPFKSEEISDNSNGIPLMRGINITEGFVRHNKDIDRFFLGDTQKLEKYRLKTNDLVIGMDGSKVGKNSALITEKSANSLLIQRVARLRTVHEVTIKFIFQQINSTKFHSYVDRINTSSGIPHISADQINEFKICFPSLAEQQKIASCLSSFDELITAQSQKTEALKVHKKGLMQGLFPAMSELPTSRDKL